jgi:hypothetical protein
MGENVLPACSRGQNSFILPLQICAWEIEPVGKGQRGVKGENRLEWNGIWRGKGRQMANGNRRPISNHFLIIPWNVLNLGKWYCIEDGLRALKLILNKRKGKMKDMKMSIFCPGAIIEVKF